MAWVSFQEDRASIHDSVALSLLIPFWGRVKPKRSWNRELSNLSAAVDVALSQAAVRFGFRFRLVHQGGQLLNLCPDFLQRRSRSRLWCSSSRFHAINLRCRGVSDRSGKSIGSSFILILLPETSLVAPSSPCQLYSHPLASAALKLSITSWTACSVNRSFTKPIRSFTCSVSTHCQ